MSPPARISSAQANLNIFWRIEPPFGASESGPTPTLLQDTCQRRSVTTSWSGRCSRSSRGDQVFIQCGDRAPPCPLGRHRRFGDAPRGVSTVGGAPVVVTGKPVPAGGMPVPRRGRPVPARYRGVPARGLNVPGRGRAVPARGLKGPAGGRPVPGRGRPVPAGGRLVPGRGRPLPGYRPSRTASRIGASLSGQRVMRLLKLHGVE